MQLYKDRKTLNELVLSASQHLNIPVEIIEKDFFVTIILKRLSEKMPNLLFKGGTSLSKCFNIIKRFSEDIDLTITDNFTQSNRKEVKRIIVETCADIGFNIINIEETKSRKDFNKYEIDYLANSNIEGIKSNIYIETFFMIKSFPAANKYVDSLLYKYLKSINREDIIKTYRLEPYKIITQTIERTFIDKIFAICDYYISGDIRERSRHIYDLYKIAEHIEFDNEFKALVQEVREERKRSKLCHSAKDGEDINKLLEEIISKNIYKKDYNEITQKLLYEDVSYDEAITIIKTINTNKIF